MCCVALNLQILINILVIIICIFLKVKAKKKSQGGDGFPPVLVAIIPLAESQEKFVKTTIEKLTSAVDDSQVLFYNA